MIGSGAKKRGLALILTAGILALLAAAAAALMATAGQLRARADVLTDGVAARLLARSGAQYAMARLQQGTPVPSTAARDNQTDDWTFRDDPETPLEKARNPSYGRGEAYDDRVPNGRYDDGVETFTDANGNGRFDAWSGRMRGRSGSADSVFALKIEGAGSRICVNDGFLDAGLETYSPSAKTRSPTTGIPRFRDLGLGLRSAVGYYTGTSIPPPGGIPPALSDVVDGPYDAAKRSSFGPSGVAYAHRRLADFVNRLGEIAGLPQPPWIGDRVVQSRPVGGYRDPEELRRAIGPAAWDRIGRFLTVFPGAGLDFPSRYDPDGSVRRTPIALAGAQAPVLQAMIQGGWADPQDATPRAGSPKWSYYAYPSDLTEETKQRRDWYWPQRPAAGDTIREEEASGLARALASGVPFATWLEFFEWLDGNKLRYFQGSPDQVNVKINAAELLLNPDPLERPFGCPYTFGPVDANTINLQEESPLSAIPWVPSLSRYSYDLARQDPRADGDRRLARFSKWLEWQRKPGQPPLPPAPVPGEIQGIYCPWGSTELDLWPVTGFEIESLGQARGARAVVKASLAPERTFWERTQADFENFQAYKRIGDDLCALGTPSMKDRMQTYPYFSFDSDPARLADRSRWRYPPEGSLRLMDASYGPTGNPNEKLYLPFWEAGQPLRPPGPPAAWIDTFADAVSGNVPGGALSAESLFPGEGVGGFQWEDAGDPKYPLRPDPPADRGVPAGTFEFTALLGHTSAALQNPGLWFGMTAFYTRDSSRLQVEFYQSAGSKRGMALNEGPKAYLHGIRTLAMPEPHPLAFTLWHHGAAAVNKPLSTVTVNPDPGGGAGVPQPPSISPTGLLNSIGKTPPPDPSKTAVPPPPDGESPDPTVGIRENAENPQPGGPDISGYIDGIPDPGLQWPEYDGDATDPSRPIGFGVGGSSPQSGVEHFLWGGADEVRLFNAEQPAQTLLARAARSRYWAPGDGRPGTPEFLSALYVFDHPVTITAMGYEGFVPRLIQDAVLQDAFGAAETAAGLGSPPMAVEVDLYRDPDGRGDPIRIDFPADLWRRGGGRIPREVGRIRSLRCRVRMDISAITGLSNETPVFDSFRVAYRRNPKISRWSQE